MSQIQSKTKILFDGNCIVCDMEIMHYKRISPEIFEMIDISSSEFNAAQYGVTAEAVNKHMHVITPEGTVLVGVDAFAHIWSRVPRYRFGARLVKWPIVNEVAKAGYSVFARYRHLLPKKSR